MKNLKLKFKKLHNNSVAPSYAKKGDAGLDMVAISREITDDYISYDTGIAVEIPEGYVGLLFPRSSISKYDLRLCNSVGVIDSGYRGSISFRFDTPIYKELYNETEGTIEVDPEYIMNSSDGGDIYTTPLSIYKVGDKIGQLIVIPYPTVELEEVKELTSSQRGKGGYGSTGN